MRKTFEEIIDEHFEDSFSDYPKIHFEKVLELMQLVRIQTLQEAADSAEADYNIIPLGEDEIVEDSIEVYVLKESILQLPKDTIEI